MHSGTNFIQIARPGYPIEPHSKSSHGKSMKNRSWIFLFSLSLFLLPLSAETWTLKEGTSLEARLLSFQRGTVILQARDGGKLLYQIEKFIEEDQERIRSLFPGGERKKDPEGPEPKKVPNQSKKSPDPPPRLKLIRLLNPCLGWPI